MANIAIMQPYFFPYAGYFRLLLDVDAFVALDCVQYLRRGWIHRNKLRTAAGEYDWLTVPFAKGDYHMDIAELSFQPDAKAEMAARMERFPACKAPSHETMPLVMQAAATEGNGGDYLVALVTSVRDALGLDTPIVRASTLNLDPSLHREDRIYEICQVMGATVYYNAPGGKSLYSADEFAKRGMDLRFHLPYQGDFASVLQRVQDDGAASVLAEMRANMT